MAYTVDHLRIVVRDTDSVVFTDTDLELYLSMFPTSIGRAAGMAVRSLAIEYSALSKSVKTDDLAIDLRSRGKDLLDVAASFESDAALADEREANDFFEIVPFADNPFTYIGCAPEGALPAVVDSGGYGDAGYGF